MIDSFCEELKIDLKYRAEIKMRLEFLSLSDDQEFWIGKDVKIVRELRLHQSDWCCSIYSSAGWLAK